MHKYFNELISLSKIYKDKIIIFFIANIKNKTTNKSDYVTSSVEAEFLSEENYDRIVSGLTSQGFTIQSYYNEEDFIADCVKNGYYQESQKQILVINSAQKGTLIGRKSLIPAFCDLLGFWYAGSNPYICSLARDKYKSNCILEHLGIATSKSYLYNYKTGWLMNIKPTQGDKVIAKLNYEASSIGLTEKNCFIYTSKKDEFIDNLSRQYTQSVVVQEFIKGFEVEYPFIRTNQILSTLPVVIAFGENNMMGNDILTYEARKRREYRFTDFRNIAPEISESLLMCSKQVIDALDLMGLCRIDFRIQPDGQIFVTDIAANPGYTEITSVRYAFYKLGYNYEQMLAILVGSIIQKYRGALKDEI